jgi:hypothetical protein
MMKDKQFKKQILRSLKGKLQETNTHIDRFRVVQKPRRPRESHIFEVRKGLLDAGTEKRLIESRCLFEIGYDHVNVSKRIQGEHRLLKKAKRLTRPRPAWSTRQAAGPKEVKQIGMQRSSDYQLT